MSQNKLAKLRNGDVYKACMRVLEEFRVPKEDYEVLDKRPHPHLTVRYCGVERFMSIPCTPKTHGKAPVAYSAQLRRMLKEMQMAALTIAAAGTIVEEVIEMQEQANLPLFPLGDAKTDVGDTYKFSFEDNEVRIVLRHGDPWFVAADVATVLDVGRTDDSVRRLDEDERGTDTIRTPGGNQKMVVINESGLYSLILTSRKEAAKRFKKWVTAEVLPQIRKTGHFGRPITIPTTAEAFASAFQMIADSERRHSQTAVALAAIGERVEIIEQLSPLKAKPQNAESLSEIRARMNRKYGLSQAIVDTVLNELPYSFRPFGMVKNSHEDAHGSSYAVYWIRDVSALFKRFVQESTRHSATTFTHTGVSRPFKLFVGDSL